MTPKTEAEAVALAERNEGLCAEVRAIYESRGSGWNGEHTANRESDATGFRVRRLHSDSDAETDSERT